MMPLPMKVCTTGMFSARANRRTASWARRRTTPLPARMRGRRAARIAWIARFTCALSGSGINGAWTRNGVSSARSSTCEAATSSGSSRWVAPGFSVCATLKAFRTASGMMDARAICACHFVTGLNSAITSMYWCDSLCIRSSEACPVMATSGTRSRFASATPVRRFVAPGPSVARQTPAFPVRRPYTSAMNAAPCSCRTRMTRIREPARESSTSRFSSPGRAKRNSTPSFSRQATSNSVAFIQNSQGHGRVIASRPSESPSRP